MYKGPCPSCGKPVQQVVGPVDCADCVKRMFDDAVGETPLDGYGAEVANAVREQTLREVEQFLSAEYNHLRPLDAPAARGISLAEFHFRNLYGSQEVVNKSSSEPPTVHHEKSPDA